MIRLIFFLSLLLLIQCNSTNGVDSQDLYPFDEINWKNSNETIRLKMYPDFRKNHEHRIIGKHKTETIKLLGEPDADSIEWARGKYTMIYGMNDATYSECPCMMDIIYDSQGIVLDVQFRDM